MFFDGKTKSGRKVLGRTSLRGRGLQKAPEDPGLRFVDINIDYKMILHLLGEVTASERLVRNVLMAKVIVHEISVCSSRLRDP